MTRKDYQLIAQAIANTGKYCVEQDIDGTALGILTTNLLSIMAEDNARFDEDRFWTACGFMKVTN